MDVKSLHQLVCNWYLMSPKLQAARITDEPRGGGAPSTAKERRLDTKLSIEAAIERLEQPDGVVLTKAQEAELAAELDRKFPTRQVIMGATACHLLGRKPGQSTLVRHDAQRKEAALLMALGIARLHARTVKAVMAQSSRVGAPVDEQDIYPFIRWEIGCLTIEDAQRIYWDALTRLSNIMAGLKEQAQQTPEGLVVLSKLIESLNSERDPDLQVSEPTVRRYVARGLLTRINLPHAGANGGPTIFVYDLEEVKRRLKLIADLRQKGEKFDTIVTILNAQLLTVN